MPLNVRCVRCGVELCLHDAFAGASCRCKHCRHIFDVPVAAPSGPRTSPRPYQPKLATDPRIRGARLAAAAVPVAAVAPAKTAGWFAGAAAWMAKPVGLISTGVFTLVLAVGAYYGVGGGSSAPGPITDLVAVSEGATATVDRSMATLPKEYHDFPPAAVAAQTYMMQPLLDTSRVMFVVDGGVDMAPYFDMVTSLTKAAMLQLKGDANSFGIALATSGQPRVKSIDRADIENYEKVKQVFFQHSPAGRSQLTLAFAAAARQRPERIYFVTARKLPASELNDISRQAESVGVATNVVALNFEDPRLQRLASANAGVYTSISRDRLMAWTQHVASANMLAKLEKEIRGSGND